MQTLDLNDCSELSEEAVDELRAALPQSEMIWMDTSERPERSERSEEFGCMQPPFGTAAYLAREILSGALRGSRHATSYAASKAYISNYLEGLNQRFVHAQLPIIATDVQPGFVGRVIDKGTKELLAALRACPGVRTDDRANQRSDPGPITPMIPISFRKGDTVLDCGSNHCFPRTKPLRTNMPVFLVPRVHERNN